MGAGLGAYEDEMVEPEYFEGRVSHGDSRIYAESELPVVASYDLDNALDRSDVEETIKFG